MSGRAQDLGVHPTQPRNWVKAFADDPQHAFPGNGQMKPEQLEIARLKREVAKLKADQAPADPPALVRITRPARICTFLVGQCGHRAPEILIADGDTLKGRKA